MYKQQKWGSFLCNDERLSFLNEREKKKPTSSSDHSKYLVLNKKKTCAYDNDTVYYKSLNWARTNKSQPEGFSYSTTVYFVYIKKEKFGMTLGGQECLSHCFNPIKNVQ